MPSTRTRLIDTWSTVKTVAEQTLATYHREELAKPWPSYTVHAHGRGFSLACRRDETRPQSVLGTGLDLDDAATAERRHRRWHPCADDAILERRREQLAAAREQGSARRRTGGEAASTPTRLHRTLIAGATSPAGAARPASTKRRAAGAPPSRRRRRRGGATLAAALFPTLHTVTSGCNRVTVYRPVILFVAMSGLEPSTSASADLRTVRLALELLERTAGRRRRCRRCRSVIAENARKRGQAWSVCTPCTEAIKDETRQLEIAPVFIRRCLVCRRDIAHLRAGTRTCGAACRNVLSRLLRSRRRPAP